MENNTCVCCGRIIPEGLQICRSCESRDEPPARNNGDMLRAMSNQNLAKWLVYVASIVISCDEDSYTSVKKWLDSPCDRPVR